MYLKIEVLLCVVCYQYHVTYPKVLPIKDSDINFFEGRIMLQNYKIETFLNFVYDIPKVLNWDSV